LFFFACSKEIKKAFPFFFSDPLPCTFLLLHFSCVLTYFLDGQAGAGVIAVWQVSGGTHGQLV